jgi:hypothetical protein
VTSRLPVRSALSAPPTVLTVAAYGAAALALGYATVSAYWTAGGTALLSTVGGAVEDAARRGGGAAVLLGLAVTGMKLGGAGVALALVRPWGRRLPTRLLEGTALTGGLLLTGYGGLLVLVGAAALLGAFRPSAGRPDGAALARRRVGRLVPAVGCAAHRGGGGPPPVAPQGGRLSGRPAAAVGTAQP